jgi:hypothetical protein
MHRVAAERKVLNFINSNGRFNVELYGLSKGAIETWIDKLSPHLVGKNELFQDMLEVAAACQSLADISEFVYTSAEMIKYERLFECLNNLKSKYC